MKNRYLIILLFLSHFAMPQQPGDQDNSFTVGLFSSSGGLGCLVWDVAQQSDNKILVGTTCTSFNGVTISGILRLNPDGSLDTSFAPPSGITYVEKIIIQPDDKIIIIGDLGQYKSIARLNIDGSLDSTFNTGLNTDSNASIHSAVIQSDGKIIIAGTFNSFNGIARNKLARINSDGSLDDSFATVNGLQSVNYNSLSIFIQSNNKIILAGIYWGITALESRIDLARLDSEGIVDSSFVSQVILGNQGSGNPLTVSSIQTQTDGKILIVGRFLTNNNISSIVRLNQDGSIDSTFNPGTGATGAFLGTLISHALIEPSGKIILVGNFQFYFGFDSPYTPRHIVRINPEGSIDTSFPLEGISVGDTYAAALQTDGKILLGGGVVIRLLSDVNLGIPTSIISLSKTIVSPVPVRDVLTITSATSFSEIIIYNGFDQILRSKGEDASEKTIDVSSLATGIYFVKILSDEKSEVRKIIKN